ncbi:hypothetical protein EDB80DRAFT_826433 [Ilyonectria destructans]|nr:hypothetical protein EDB80DRAFT_826433 [Ilyonectria destructans]
MAMDALENLAKNVPGWLKQLDDLVQKNHPGANSLRNKGSTKSLRPMDGVSIFLAPEPIPDDTISDDATLVATEPSTPPTELNKRFSPFGLPAVKQSLEAIKVARKRQQVKGRRRASSVVSAEGAPPAY